MKYFCSKVILIGALLLGACQRPEPKLLENPLDTTQQAKNVERSSKDKVQKTDSKEKEPEKYEQEESRSQFQQEITEAPYEQIGSDKFDQLHKQAVRKTNGTKGFLMFLLNLSKLKSNVKIKTTTKRPGTNIKSTTTKRQLSGIIVHEDGYVITNRHGRFSEADLITVSKRSTLFFRKSYKAVLIAEDDEYDLALLKIEQPSKKFPFARFGDSQELGQGDIVIHTGYPKNKGDITVGAFLGHYNDGRGATEWGDAPMFSTYKSNKGASGGAVFNDKFELVGIHSGQRIEFSNQKSRIFCYAIPTHVVQAFIKKYIPE